MDKVEELRGLKVEIDSIVEKQEGDAASQYRRGFFEGRAFEITTGMDEHPEWWEHGCNCDLCRSYG